MRITSRFAVVAIVLATLVCVAVPRAAQNVACYFDQGGAGLHFGNGCTGTVESGGTLNVAAGGSLKIAGTALTSSAAAFNNLLQGTAANKKVASNQATTVTASDTIVTGLTTVTSCIAVMDDAPTTDPEIASCSIGNQTGAPAAGSILITTWKTFGGTPAGATTFSKKVNWIAFGG